MENFTALTSSMQASIKAQMEALGKDWNNHTPNFSSPETLKVGFGYDAGGANLSLWQEGRSWPLELK